jgi:hypothetical protein
MADNQRLRDERAKQIVETWKTIVSVQMHFNDIGMRIRAMFVTILLALFASIGFLLDKKLVLELGPLNIQYATLIPLFGIFGTMLFYFVDRYWFHRLLKGSVNHAIEIENKYGAQLPEITLSAEIGKESFFIPTGILWLAAKIFVRHEKFKEKKQLHSDGKLEIFYKSVMLALFLTFLLLVFFGGITWDRKVQWKWWDFTVPT